MYTGHSPASHPNLHGDLCMDVLQVAFLASKRYACDGTCCRHNRETDETSQQCHLSL